MSGVEIVGLVLGVMSLAFAPHPPAVSAVIKSAKYEKKAQKLLDGTKKRLSIYSKLFFHECKTLLGPLNLNEEDIKSLFGKDGAQDARWKSKEFVVALEGYLGRSSMELFSEVMSEIHHEFGEIRQHVLKFQAKGKDPTNPKKLTLKDRNRIIKRKEKVDKSLNTLQEWIYLLSKEVKKFLDTNAYEHGKAPNVIEKRVSLARRPKWDKVMHHLTDSQKMSARLSDYILRCGCSCHFFNMRLDFRVDERRKNVFRLLVRLRTQDNLNTISMEQMEVDTSFGVALQELGVEIRKFAKSRCSGNHTQIPSVVASVPLSSSSLASAMMPPPLPPSSVMSNKRKRVMFAAISEVSDAVKFRKTAPKPPPAPEQPSASIAHTHNPQKSGPDEIVEEEETCTNLPVLGSLCMTLNSSNRPDLSPLQHYSNEFFTNCFGRVKDLGDVNANDGEVNYLLYDQGDRQYPEHHLTKSTLRDILARESEFYVRDRLKLALQLASSLLTLHLRSWMSTNWRSGDVLLLEDNLKSSTPGDPPEWLPYTVNDVKTIQSIDRRTRQTPHFQRSYIYSLGVILLEIGRSSPIDIEFENDDDERLQVRDLMYQSVIERSMGMSYKRVVETCLSWHKKLELGDRCNDLTREEVQKVFYEEVVDQLRYLFERQCTI